MLHQMEEEDLESQIDSKGIRAVEERNRKIRSKRQEKEERVERVKVQEERSEKSMII